MSTATKEVKSIGGDITQCKQIERDGKKLGIVEGHIATFDIDRGDDRFSPGVFNESIEELKRLGKTHLPLKDSHGRTIGGFPLDQIKEDSKGVFAVGEINLEIELGRDAYSLAQQKVYDSFSVGFISLDVDWIDDIREIRKGELLEASLLDIPMNLNARVTEVKELAKLAGIEGMENATDEECEGLIKVVKSYKEKLTSKSNNKNILTVEKLMELDERTLEGMFKDGVSFSGKLAKTLVSVVREAVLRDVEGKTHRDGDDDWSGVLDKLDEIIKPMED